jgi:nucleotide-binding universal stress UspA family protein
MARRKLVIGFNGTSQGEDALELGRVLGEGLDAQPAVAVVAHLPRGADQSELDGFCGPVFEQAARRLDAHHHPVLEHSVARGLHDLAEDLSASAIVLGSARHGPAARVMLGSTAGALLTGAPCAVAVAPLGYADTKNELKRVGVAVDGSAQSWRALQAAATLARDADVRLSMMTVAVPHHYALGGALSPYSREQYEQRKEREDEAVLEEARDRLPDDLEAESVLLHGDPAEALPEAGADLDLLMVGSRGYGPAKGAILGSVSAKLIAASPCPVLVVPRGSGADPLGA